MHNVSQDASLGPAVASCGLVTSGGTAVGAIKRHVQCAVDRRVAGVARRHVPGHMSIGARTACCLRHSICWLRDDTRAPMTKRASSRRRSGECALLLRPLNLRYLIGWRCAGLSVDWAARNCGGFAQQLLWHARATKAGVQQARCLSKQDSLHGYSDERGGQLMMDGSLALRSSRCPTIAPSRGRIAPSGRRGKVLFSFGSG